MKKKTSPVLAVVLLIVVVVLMLTGKAVIEKYVPSKEKADLKAEKLYEKTHKRSDRRQCKTGYHGKVSGRKDLY